MAPSVAPSMSAIRAGTFRRRRPVRMPVTPVESIFEATRRLEKFRFLSAVPPRDLEALGRPQVVELRRGSAILSADGGEGGVYLVESGSLKFVADAPGTRKETILSLLGPGELFGRMPLLDDDDRPWRAVALDDTVLLRLRVGDIERLVDLHPELATRLTRMVGGRLRRIENRVGNLLFKDARQRVAFILLDLLEDWGRAATGGGLLLNLRVTHQDLANLTGLTRETVSVTLAEFDLEEIIRTQGRRIIVQSALRLRAVMHGGDRHHARV